MNVFDLREQLVRDYGDFIRGFLKIRDAGLNAFVHQSLDEGVFWPEPYISLNPAFASGGYVDDLVAAGTLHGCLATFRRDEDKVPGGLPLRLHRHQVDAIEAAACGGNYVLSTGTGSGKSLSYIVPIVDRILRDGTGGNSQIKAIVIYPTNALANSQAASCASSCPPATPTAVRSRSVGIPARRATRNAGPS